MTATVYAIATERTAALVQRSLNVDASREKPGCRVGDMKPICGDGFRTLYEVAFTMRQGVVVCSDPTR